MKKLIDEGIKTVIRVWNSIKQEKQQDFENKLKELQEIKEIEGERLYYRIIKSGETLILKGLPITLCNDVVCYSGNWNLIENRECAPTVNEENGWTTVVMSNKTYKKFEEFLGPEEEFPIIENKEE
jgi:hypothetical protein